MENIVEIISENTVENIPKTKYCDVCDKHVGIKHYDNHLNTSIHLRRNESPSPNILCVFCMKLITRSNIIAHNKTKKHRNGVNKIHSNDFINNNATCLYEDQFLKIVSYEKDGVKHLEYLPSTLPSALLVN